MNSISKWISKHPIGSIIFGVIIGVIVTAIFSIKIEHPYEIIKLPDSSEFTLDDMKICRINQQYIYVTTNLEDVKQYCWIIKDSRYYNTTSYSVKTFMINYCEKEFITSFGRKYQIKDCDTQIELKFKIINISDGFDLKVDSPFS